VLARCVNLILIASPEKIVFGGGVMKRECLFPKIRAAVREMLNGYVQVDQILTDKIDEYIVSSDFGNDAGLIGCAFLLALF
jgi:fructokinase